MKRHARRALLALGAAACATLLLAGTANAYSITGTTAATAGLNARQDVNGAQGPISGGKVVATIPNKSTVYIDCYWYDAGVTGPWGTTRVWDAIEGYRTPNGTYHDLSGYTGQIFVSDAWVDTGGDTSKLVTPCYGF